MRFEFATSGRILFGPGTTSELGGLAQSLGVKALVAVDSSERSAPLIEQMRAAGVTSLPHPTRDEPTVASIQAALDTAKQAGCDLVVGIGGGSALDTGKAVAALLSNPGNLLDYLEVIGKGRALKKPSAPFIAVPTTAGTGSEVTRNAVISSPEHRLKSSLRSPLMLPRAAIVDPELTYSLPPDVTASTGMDALTQLIEPYTSNATNPMVDAICEKGIPSAARSLSAAYRNGQDISAREGMSLASLLGGLALANGKLGAVHGMANPIGGMCHAPHGAICARLLPLVMDANINSLRRQMPESPALDRYTQVARLLTGDERAAAEDGIAWVKQLCLELRIRPLAEFGLLAEDFPELVRQSQKANSMKGNAIGLSDSEIQFLLESSL